MSLPSRSLRRGRLAAAAGLALALAPAPQAAAHEVPVDVAVQAWIKPESTRLRVLLRAPLAAMRDVRFPTDAKGVLDIAGAEAALREAVQVWLAEPLELYEDETRLGPPRIAAVRVSLPSDRSFASFDAALRSLLGAPLPESSALPWDQGLLDALLEYEVRSERSRFSIRPGFERLGLRVVTALRFVPPGGTARAFELVGDPGLVRLDPRWHQAALRFVEAGLIHILSGADHLLFLFCLVIPFRRLLPLLLVVTSFTLAHSITLIGSAFGLASGALWFPPLIEMLIALSIVWMALENIVAPQLRRRWLIAFGFGLVHGFGFSFALRETLQFAGAHLLTALVSFNLGVELGQLLVLLLLLPALAALFRFVVTERLGTILLSAFVAHSGWHWTLERADALRQYRFEWPALDAALLLVATRWLILSVIAVAAAWLVFVVLLAPLERRAGSVATADADD